MEEPTFDSILEPDQEEPTPEETAPPPAGDSDTPPNTVPTHPSPALTIHFQSWATPVGIWFNRWICCPSHLGTFTHTCNPSPF